MAIAEQVITDRYALYNGDCCEVTPTLPDQSVDVFVSSPPFCGLFHYSSSEKDLSNCRSYEEFFEHYEFVVSESHRLLKPGRISAVHCMDVPKDGANICGYRDFPGDIIRLHEKIGFEYTPRINIWKEPLAVRNRTMSKALAHRQIVEDSTKTNIAAADYLIPFRKKGKNKVPVTHPTGLARYAGSREIPKDLLRFRNFKGNQIKNRYSHWIWRHYASCFWDDVRLGRVLPYQESRDKDDEKHMHRLQLDVIERACVLWSNPDEVVMTQFMGVGSEVYGALVNGRRAIGVELKKIYFEQAKKNVLLSAAEIVESEDLYAGIELEEVAE
jgi:DNA modification methylase